MQVLYVVEFDIRSLDSVSDPYTAALASLASWLSFAAGRQIAADVLGSDGQIELQANPEGVPRTAKWELIGVSQAEAIRVEIRDEDHNSDTAFVTRVTLGKIDGSTTVRVSMARESSPMWLSPAPPPDLRQPGVIRSLLENDQIAISIGGQLQDGRYLQVRTEAEVATLVDAIRSSVRLPILLVHTRTLPALETARIAANKLVGLVRVVTLDYRASRALDTLLPGYAPPRAGARLIWSDPDVPTVPVDEDRINAGASDGLRAYLMRLVAPLSVLARGLDNAYREARRANIDQRDRDVRVRSAQALVEGSTNEQVEVLQEELAVIRENAAVWQQLAYDQEQRADRYQAEAEKVPALEEQVEQLTIALRARSEFSDEDATDESPWTKLPVLVKSNLESAKNLFLHLEDATSSRVVFTDRAATSWKKSKYPFPDEMTECLTKLAHVAEALYGGENRSYPHLDTWIRDEFDLKVALQDDTIENNSKLRDFEYEGDVYNRTPHVKVRDRAPRTQVGRIHFALDAKNGRLIVDHVGLKLY